MSFTLQDALDILEETEVELILQFPKELTQQIAQLLTPEEFKEYLFAKNIKIFGGINEYANDIFDKGTIEKVKNKPMNVGLALAAILTKILEYPGLTDHNKRRISQAIRELNQTPSSSAPAAGGAGRASAKKLKRRY
jgi:hypothetical protein